MKNQIEVICPEIFIEEGMRLNNDLRDLNKNLRKYGSKELQLSEAELKVLREARLIEIQIRKKRLSEKGRLSENESGINKIRLESEILKLFILEYLIKVGTARSIRELREECGELSGCSGERIFHLLEMLVINGDVIKEFVEKTPYYYAAF